MADITGSIDGYTYRVNWIRIEPRSVHCSAVVHDANGRRMGQPDITLRGEFDDEQAASAIRLWIEGAIRNRVGVER